MAHSKASWFHSWEWDGYRLRRCVMCGLCQEDVQLGLMHRPSHEWRTTTRAIGHFAKVDRNRSEFLNGWNK